MKKWLFLLSNIFFAGTIQASTVISITEHEITEQEMVGMVVEITTVNGLQSINWDGNNAGGLTYADPGDDTFVGTWTFTNETGFTINQIRLDAFGASAVFDIELADDDVLVGGQLVSTAASHKGDFFNSGNGTVSFEDSVNIVTEQAVGDLFRFVTFTFDTPLEINASFDFNVDTDKVQAVPLPAGIVLFLSSLMGLLGFKVIGRSY